MLTLKIFLLPILPFKHCTESIEGKRTMMTQQHRGDNNFCDTVGSISIPAYMGRVVQKVTIERPGD